MYPTVTPKDRKIVTQLAHVLPWCGISFSPKHRHLLATRRRKIRKNDSFNAGGKKFFLLPTSHQNKFVSVGALTKARTATTTTE
jgi:hypothetical protein